MNYDLDKIIVLDDVVPQWLHDQAINQVLHYPLSFGHRGLGQYQGHQIFSQQFSQAELENTPWTLKAVWHAFEHHKNLIDNDVGDIQLNQVQINLTTKEHTGGLHVDSGDDVPAYTMVYLIHGDTGMDFWDGDPEKDGKKIDSKKLKQILKLPAVAEISMVISCGIRKPEGIYGERFRIPFEEVYFER